MIEANNPELRSWIAVSEDSDFPIQNLPIGVFKTPTLSPRLATRIGDKVIDLQVLAELEFFEDLGIKKKIFSQSNINELLKLGKTTWRALRQRLSDLFRVENHKIGNNKTLQAHILYAADSVEMLLPVHIGNYTDFYASREHATNVGIMFRGKENALMPNWLHLPVGYHGRASSITVSGTAVHRPKGQMRPNDSEPPVFGATRQLDFELEMAYIMGEGKPLGHHIGTEEADEYIFGLALFNDWSARDIQRWEYVPLGPFLGKNFFSSLSPWIVMLDALEPFRCAAPTTELPLLPYLQYNGDKALDINLEVLIGNADFAPHTVSRSNFKYMYWTMEQQLAHHTVNGCNIIAGDVLASGTISGEAADSYGSMLELAWKGERPLEMPDGSKRVFLQDGDTVILRGYAQKDSVRVGFGELYNKILPSIPA